MRWPSRTDCEVKEPISLWYVCWSGSSASQQHTRPRHNLSTDWLQPEWGALLHSLLSSAESFIDIRPGNSSHWQQLKPRIKIMPRHTDYTRSIIVTLYEASQNNFADPGGKIIRKKTKGEICCDHVAMSPLSILTQFTCQENISKNISKCKIARGSDFVWIKYSLKLHLFLPLAPEQGEAFYLRVNSKAAVITWAAALGNRAAWKHSSNQW